VTTTQALVIPVDTQDVPYALQVARSTRAGGVQTEVDVTGHGVGAGLKLAAKKHIALALIVGEDEQRANQVTVRNLGTGEEQVLDVESFIHNLQEKE
jgi:histidyl-tRNA synthetase